jgi:phage terminase small subunit
MAISKYLTDMQYNFVLNYVRNGFNAYQAARSSGYSEDTAKAEAYKLLAKPLVKQHIAKAQEKVDQQRLNKLYLTMEQKAKVLTRIIYDVVPKDKTQEPKREYYKDALKAISEMNKMQGDYAPEKRLSLTVDATKDKLKEINKQYEEY